MTLIIAKQDLRDEDVKKYREAAVNLLKAMIASVGKNPDEYIFRDILPSTDLGLASDDWSISYAAANTEETKINKTLEENKFIAFYGYTNLSANPKTVWVKFYKGSEPIDVFHVQKLYSKDDPTGLFPPIGYKEGDVTKVSFYGNAAGTDRPVLLGVVAERRGVTVTRK